MFFEDEINLLLKPGYQPMETGYYHLPNGQLYVASLVPLPGCKGKWVDWWFGTYLKDTNTFRQWAPETIAFGWDEKWKPGYYLGASTYLEMPEENKTTRYIRKYVDPAKYFNTSNFTETGIEAAICAESFTVDGVPNGRVIHIARRTDSGCEMRIRFWMNETRDEVARLHLEHSIIMMLRMSESLRSWAKNTVISGNDIGVSCKYCHSDQVVKNGLRQDVQTWLCKNCGHSFIDNQALPKMRYPAYVIASAVHDYYDGYSIRRICDDIEKTTGVLPSSSTVYGWVKKLTEKALSVETNYHPLVGDNWAMYKSQIQMKTANLWLVNIIDVDTQFLLATRLFGNINGIDIHDLILTAVKKAGKSPREIITNIGREYSEHIGSIPGVDLKPIRMIFVGDKELNDNFKYLFPGLFNNRLRPRSNVDISNIGINGGIPLFLNGFIFHHNYVGLPDNSFDIPAKAAGIQYPFKDWMNILGSEISR